jgi:hypothetical protein
MLGTEKVEFSTTSDTIPTVSIWARQDLGDSLAREDRASRVDKPMVATSVLMREFILLLFSVDE